MKKTSMTLVVVLLMDILSPLTVFADGDTPNYVKIEFDGKTDILDNPARIIDGRTFVPIRYIFEKLGMTVTWEGDIRTVKAVDNENLITIEVDTGIANINGKEVMLESPAKIINGTTMIPVRFISEELGMLVEWDDASKKVLIYDYSDIHKLIKQGKLEELDKKISYIYDERLFTLYAFMNYTGYDRENNKNGFNDIRKQVLSELRAKNLDLSDNNYYKNKGIEYWYYEHALDQMGKAPDFEIIGSKNNIKSGLWDLNSKLKEFHTKANISELYEKYKPAYMEQLQKYKNIINREVLRCMQYLKLDISDVPEFYLQVNLLDSYDTGSGLGSEDLLLGQGIITTLSMDSSNGVNRLNIIHEFLHGIINPILYDLGESDKDEDFVRALSAMIVYGYEDGGKDIIDYQVRRGYKMAEYISERFNNDWWNYNGSLKDFVKDIIENY